MPSELARLRKGYGYLEKINWVLVDALLAHHARPIHVVPTGVVYEWLDLRADKNQSPGSSRQ
jgi:hypothetical protein